MLHLEKEKEKEIECFYRDLLRKCEEDGGLMKIGKSEEQQGEEERHEFNLKQQ